MSGCGLGVIANGGGVSVWDEDSSLNWMVVMVTQHCEHTNTTEPCTSHGWVWCG